MENILIDFQNKNGKLICSNAIMKLVREKFSIKNPSFQSYKFVPRLYSITPSGSFQIGLWSEIENYIRSLNVAVNITLTEEFTAQFQPKTGIDEISTVEGFSYYDYQKHTLKEFIKNGRGISLIATGGGKALIVGGLCKTFLENYPEYKILIIVPNVSLLNQLYYSFLNEFKIDDITRWGDGNLPDMSKNIIIANSQILIYDISHTLSVVQNFDVVIFDEVHTINDKKNKISKIIYNIHTPKKFGLTGTLPDSLASGWNVIGKIGPILYEKTSYDLRNQNTITDVSVKVIFCKHTTIPIFPKKPLLEQNPTDDYNSEYSYILNHSARNEVIKTIVSKLTGNTLIVVDRIQYVNVLRNCLSDIGKTILVITGDTATDDRTFIQNSMDSQNDIICIAMSKCFSTGISVKNLHYAVFAYMGKGNVKTVQTIGRTVRKHESKDRAIIFDIADNLEYSSAHLKHRLQIYKKQKIDYTISKITI